MVSDSVGLLSKFNLDSKKIVCAYKGCTGAVSAIQVFNTAINNKAGSDTDDHEDDEEEATGMDMVVAVGLDRFLRVWELDSSKLFNKVNTVVNCPYIISLNAKYLLIRLNSFISNRGLAQCL